MPDLADDVAWVDEVYASYAGSLYAYCRSLVREPAAAADAVRDTFVVLAFRLADLPDESLLRPWLFAVARNECLRAISFGHAAPAVDFLPTEAEMDLPAPLAPAPPVPAPLAPAAPALAPPTFSPVTFSPASFPPVTPVAMAGPDGMATAGPRAPAEADSAQARSLLGTALGGLGAEERDIMLMVWHGLDVAECAEVLGIHRDEASRRFFRARGELEASVGVLVAARSNWHECAALNAMLAGWDGRLTPALRARLHQHIDHCDICADQRRTGLTPTVLLSLSPEALRGIAETATASRLTAWVTGRLREQVLAAAFDQELESFEHRAMVVRRAGPFRDNDGFPVALLPPGAVPRRGRSRLPVILVGAAAAVLIVGVVGVALLVTGNYSAGALPAWTGLKALSGTFGATGTSVSANASGSPRGAGPSTASPSHRPSPASHRSSGVPTPPASTGTSAPPTPATTAPPPPPAGISVSPTSVTINTGGPSALTLTNPSGAAVNWSVAIPSGSRLAAWGPTAGQLQPHQSVRVYLHAQYGHGDGNGHGNGNPSTVVVTVNPGNVQVTVSIPGDSQQG